MLDKVKVIIDMVTVYRYYLNKMDMKRCTRTTDDSEMCISKIMDCEQARASKNFTGTQ